MSELATEAYSDDYPVHPAAAVFPMLDADELAELADDILTNGLISPLVLDAAGEMLVDGRNRREACRIAGVEPRYECLPDGVDPVGYIVSTNIERRHLTKGQRAMAQAMLYPEPAKGGRGKRNSSETEGFSPARLSQARTILRVAEDLARQVMAGTTHFDDALRQAVEMSDRIDRMRIKELEIIKRATWGNCVTELNYVRRAA